jgi:muramidase (phage lysozyme)
MLMFLGVIGVLFHWSSPNIQWPYRLPKTWFNPSKLLRLGSANWVTSPLPLAMVGGDPYIRALMRTISASESNMDQPYHLLYGGQTLKELSQHPDTCIPIEAGPNVGDCTTAAGRYQFLTTTWQAKAQKYHPYPPGWFEFWQTYDFSPETQDIVVYRWLSDSEAWGTDISQQLQNGEITEVLKLLSGTWTSLGYGIETNSMSSQLPRIYSEMLQEEQSVP